MGVYSVPVTIGVDEESIAANIEKEAERRVLEQINRDVRAAMFKHPSSRGIWLDDEKDEIKDYIIKEIRACVKEHEDLIIMQAVSDLVKRLVTRKKVTDLLIEISEKMDKEEESHE